MEPVQPIVLVGGSSRRFGRDKLREPLSAANDEWLVDRSIAALRAVFGPVVKLVGRCDPLVLARGDGGIEDTYADRGPIGGIVSALEQGRAAFVLAGDLPNITADVVFRIMTSAAHAPTAWAVLARSDRLEPCVGLYRSAALPALTSRLHDAAGRRSLHDALPAEHVVGVECGSEHLVNANVPEDLATTANHRPTRQAPG